MTRFDYENKEFDTLTDQYDFHFRQYKPSTGLFGQPDTLIQNVYDLQSLNRYMFERGNPYKYTDPTGHYDVQTQGADGMSKSFDTFATKANQNFFDPKATQDAYSIGLHFLNLIGKNIVSKQEVNMLEDEGLYRQYYAYFYKNNNKYSPNPYYEMWSLRADGFMEKQPYKSVPYVFAKTYATMGKTAQADYTKYVLNSGASSGTLLVETFHGKKHVSVGNGLYVSPDKVKSYLRMLKWKEDQKNKWK
ncbi:MAG: RHS repeat-associated core domain-containing protein [archaeon]